MIQQTRDKPSRKPRNSGFEPDFVMQAF